MNVREKLEKLIKEKKSLPECARKREIEQEIQQLKLQKQKELTTDPVILVKHAGKPIGTLEYNQSESSWIFKNNNGSVTEVGFQYHEARSWASLNGFQLKVEMS